MEVMAFINISIGDDSGNGYDVTMAIALLMAMAMSLVMGMALVARSSSVIIHRWAAVGNEWSELGAG